MKVSEGRHAQYLLKQTAILREVVVVVTSKQYDKSVLLTGNLQSRNQHGRTKRNSCHQYAGKKKLNNPEKLFGETRPNPLSI